MYFAVQRYRKTYLFSESELRDVYCREFWFPGEPKPAMPGAYEAVEDLVIAEYCVFRFSLLTERIPANVQVSEN